jgi:glutathione S-transferase
MHTLYFSPGACSMAPHILLHELNLPHRTVRVFTGDEEHRAAAYLELNPLGKIPTLVRDDGATLTEVAAILPYLAALAPSAGLWPEDPWGRAQAGAWLGLIASQVHPAYALAIRPDRTLPGASEATLVEARAGGRRRFEELLDHLEARFVGPFALGESFSVVDPYLFVMLAWARYIDVSLQRRPRLQDLSRRMATRPSVQATFVAEALVDAQGRPTPPVRV